MFTNLQNRNTNKRKQEMDKARFTYLRCCSVTTNVCYLIFIKEKSKKSNGTSGGEKKRELHFFFFPSFSFLFFFLDFSRSFPLLFFSLREKHKKKKKNSTNRTDEIHSQQRNLMRCTSVEWTLSSRDFNESTTIKTLDGWTELFFSLKTKEIQVFARH